MRSIIYLLAIGVFSLLISCKKKDTEEVCSKAWSTAGNYGFFNIADGALTVTGQNMTSTPGITVYQTGLEGDFVVEAEFEGFTSGSSGTFCQMAAGPGITGTIIDLVGYARISSSGLLAGAGSTTNSAFSSATSGTLRIERVDSLVTSTVTVGSTTATSSKKLCTEIFQVGFQVGKTAGSGTGSTSFRITKFTVTGGGNKIGSDEFDCNSVF